MEPDVTPTTPAAASAAPATPAAAPSAPATPPAAPSSASGPGFSGGVSGSGTPNPAPSVPPAAPGFTAAAAPANAAAAAAAAPDFDTQFQQRYGMSPAQAQMLISMGYRTYQGQQTPPAAATQPQTQQPATPQNPFGLPKFDMGLLSMVGRDPATGQLVNLPGAPPDAAWQVQQYQEKLKEVQQGFFQDPMKYLGDQIAERVRAEAAKVYEQQFGGYQQQQTTQQILAENASWLYATDAQGNPEQRFNPATGRMERQLSPYGQYYAQQVQQLVSAGVTDPKMQHQLAKQALENALLVQERQRLQAPAAGAAAGTAFTQQAAANPPAAPVPSHNMPPAAPGVSLKERMRQAMESNGLTNDVVQQQLNRVA